jgi:hypothetical protein
VQRIEVTGDGVAVTYVTEPLVSAYGKEMRPGSTDLYELPWDELSGVSLAVTELPPDGERWITLVIDVIWGAYLEVHEDAEGFADAVHELCRLSGLPVPEYAASTTDGITIWPGAAH